MGWENGGAAAVELEAAKQAVREAVDELAPALKAASRQIYEHPELGLEERFASGLLSGTLEQAGFAIERGVAGLPTSFVGTWPGAKETSARPGPTVAILAEYDALPGVGHGCGHNIIGTAAVGAGMALARLGALPGRIVVVGCPAEEGGVDGAGGKVVLVEAGIFAGVDAALMVHPAGQDAPSGRSSCRLALAISFKGKTAHAGGAPHEGINALEGVIQTFNAINALRQHLPGSVRVHGIIAKGGEAPNIVPDEGLIRLYVRASTMAELEPVAEKVKNCAKGAAMATGCQLSFREFAHTYVDLVTNEPLDEAFSRNMKALGRTPARPGGAGRGSGSTDMGNVSHVVAAIHPYVGIGEHGTGPASHSREFAEATIGPRGEEALIVSAKALAMTSLDLLLSTEVLEAVKSAGPPGRRKGSAGSTEWRARGKTRKATGKEGAGQ